jgi:fructosamine-3-kinase
MIDDVTTLDEAYARIAGDGVSVVSERSVGGGCISNGTRVELSNGTVYFVKRSTTLPGEMFTAEAAGLEALGDGDGPRVPDVYACSSGGAADGRRARGEAFIVMEWIEPGSKRSSFDAGFGSELAAMHRRREADRYGFRTDNFIGSTPQPNGWMESWHDFFAERRIRYQTRLARDRGLIDDRTVSSIESILGRLDSILPEPEHPSILHGDLWGGNYLVDDEGRPVLIDPAVYYGHREADLAMTELFGGFSSRFYASYREAWPLDPGYENRSSLYNLYHMLNHANLFGGSYSGSVRSIVRRYA